MYELFVGEVNIEYNMRLAYLIVVVAVNLAQGNTEDVAGPEVTIPQGTLRGVGQKTENGRDVDAFLGIPFAKPPVGELRFTAPEPADRWTGIWNATQDATKCIQRHKNGKVRGGEDCLYLNVFTPALANEARKKLLPVMVYVFGGFFDGGKVDSAAYNGKYLLDEDVLLVIPAYRLGVLGFLSTDDEAASGNWALKDLVLAFEWVRDNIIHFGGDPNQVTLFGHSSGAVTVHYLALSPLMDGLFHRWITQSGSALSPSVCHTREKAKDMSIKTGDAVGCPTNDSNKLVHCLRNQSALALVNADLIFNTFPGLSTHVWFPTAEGDRVGAAMIQCPIDAVDPIRDLPWMNGVVRDEGLTFLTCYYVSGEYLQRDISDFRKNLTDLVDQIIPPVRNEAYKKAIFDEYFGIATADIDALARNATLLIGDVFVIYPAWLGLQKQVALAKSPTYFYTIEHVPSFSFMNVDCGFSEVLGITHCDELLWLFNYLRTVHRVPTAADLDMSRKLCHMWATFATTGVPLTHGNTTIWEPYNVEDNNVLRIGQDESTELVIQHIFREERMKFWDRLNALFS